MTKSSITRNKGLDLGRAAFESELQKDPDFISFKQRAYDYGVLVATKTTFMLNQIALTSEQLIKQYQTT